MGHHQNKGAVRSAGKFIHRRFRPHDFETLRNVGRERVGTRIDPAHRERQRRQRQRQRAPDMAGSETAGVGCSSGVSVFARACEIVEISRVKNLDGKIDPAAAALGKVGAEREGEPALGAAPFGERLARRIQGAPFEGAAADGAVKAAGGAHDHRRAFFARRRARRRFDARQRRQALGGDRFDEAAGRGS